MPVFLDFLEITLNFRRDQRCQCTLFTNSFIAIANENKIVNMDLENFFYIKQ
jgi:hypothetical protein